MDFSKNHEMFLTKKPAELLKLFLIMFRLL